MSGTSPMYFSPSKLGFYPAVLLSAYQQAGTLPGDLVPVTQAAWLAFSQQPPSGKALGQSAGQPVWV
jgi:hypothetical protein